MHPDPAFDIPSFHARTTEFIGRFWPEQQFTYLPTPTSMPLSFVAEQAELDATANTSIASRPGATTFPSAETTIAAIERMGHEASSLDRDRVDTRHQGTAGAIETTLPLAPYPGSAPQLPAAFAGVTNASHPADSLVRAALTLLMQNSAEQGSSSSGITPNPLASTLARDSLLIYAHRIFNLSAPTTVFADVPRSTGNIASAGHPYNRQLLPLLQRLRALHPRHLPTLLLLGCVHYALGNFKESLSVNEEILQIDADFVEAMSNMGTTLKAMGQPEDAIQWWWKAIHLRPNYWDAVNNLLGALVAGEQERSKSPSDRKYTEALRLCETVQTQLVGENGRLLVSIAPQDLHHLLNLFYVSGSIRSMSGQSPSRNGLRDFTSAIETLLQMKGSESTVSYNFKHLLLAACVGGLLMSSAVPDSIVQLASNAGYSALLQRSEEMNYNILEFVRSTDDALWQLIIEEGGGMVPAIFMSPAQATNLFSTIFNASSGLFPSLCSWSEASESLERPREDVASKASEMTSNILLSIAKLLQESGSASVHLPRFEASIRVGPSLILLLYYLAYAAFPSPSVCNNLGIMLSTTPWMDIGGSVAIDIAQAYYEKGLELDGTHAHVLTNLGSLLKEKGELDAAIEMYARAVQARPTFDIALANLANAMKDSGRLSESIEFYRRALEVNDDLPEALCGLAHAAWSICDWRGAGPVDVDAAIDADGNMRPRGSATPEMGWMLQLIQTTRKQLAAAYQQNVGVVKSIGLLQDWIAWIEESINEKLLPQQRDRWLSLLQPFFNSTNDDRDILNEGSFTIRMVEWLTRHIQWRWYIDAFGNVTSAHHKPDMLSAEAIQESGNTYSRPHLPPFMTLQSIPSVLPFHTFIYPLSAREIRLVAHRNALRVSHSTLTRSWLPEHVYPPPTPGTKINVGYVSSDFTDHPTAHLISSLFGMHDKTKFSVYVYATSVSDGSTYRTKIEHETEGTFRDVSSSTTQEVVEQIIRDGIHILVNLNGYTKGARNDVFAARPCPIQISFLGFAGTLASGWCDYMICDPIVCPPNTRACELCDLFESFHQTSQGSSSDVSSIVEFDFGPDPDSTDEWKYSERLIYMPHTYLITDHKQCYGSRTRGNDSADLQREWKDAEDKRRKLRRELFPDIFDDTIIFANFNQMYKLDPSTYATWLRILKRVPNSILWLLRFPPAGEEHLLRTAEQWASAEIASRVRFTGVVPKDEHIERVGVADIFLDTVECNAHTIAADVLWGGTPIITWPKYTFKMCSRVGASIAFATGFGNRMVVDSLAAYEERAVSLALSVTPTSFRRDAGSTKRGELAELRHDLFMNREVMPLFDCRRWTRNLEKGYTEAWTRWVRGGTTTHFSVEGGSKHRYERCSGFIWIRDEDT
ncbi:TPR-like protein [Fomitiporia mediterranea MF3/22]|uniref:TPR-like protein n=1 Tax=Fomitiporia mediterranea (strain MF3/22) TaxID=694068 RepID=UPI0004408BAF|nr:TPR-like protein [Fomitiporia mediterranea MF3/22]EJD03950.1 TPR-like protein [Fomitiporia mediterranea MF3/22]